MIEDTEIRSDYNPKATGTAKYVTDIVLPNMAYARLVRSPYAHARILHIDITEASAVPGVIGIFTGADLDTPDIHERYWGLYFNDRPIIAYDVVRYAGEPVVAVIATTEAIADDACELIDIQYESMPHITDAHSALQPDSPLVHKHFSPIHDFYFPGGPNSVAGTNICHQYQYDQGDVESAFHDAHHTIEANYAFPGVYHYALEPHSVIADFSGNVLNLWSNGQTPTAIKRVCARIFGLSLADIRVHIPYIGGGFGGKASVKIDPLAAALSKYVGRPVMLRLSLMESMLTCRRVGTFINIKTAVDSNNRLIARSIDVLGDCGAYADTGPASTTKAAYRAIGPYNFPNLRLRARAVYTNSVPAASFRSIGGPQGTWASESQIDELAHELGLSPIAFRRHNLAPKNTKIKADLRPIDTSLRDALDAALQLLPENSSAQDIGVATAATDPGILPISSVLVRLHADGAITVQSTTSEVGQGARGVQRLIAARYLNQPISKVRVLEPDTQSAPWDWGTGASRSTIMVGLAIEDAASQIRRQIYDAAVQSLDIDEESISLAPGGIEYSGTFMTFAELLRNFQGITAGEFAALGRITPYSKDGALKERPIFWETSACACRISVDTGTGQITVNDLALSSDAGTLLNPKAAEGQDHGAIVQGLGHTLSEHYIYQDGQVVNATAFDYRVPSSDDIPTIRTKFLEPGDGPGPFGARGLGEGSILPIAPAIANALYNITGKRIRELPLTPEAVWLSLHQDD